MCPIHTPYCDCRRKGNVPPSGWFRTLDCRVMGIDSSHRIRFYSCILLLLTKSEFNPGSHQPKPLSCPHFKLSPPVTDL